MPAQADGSILSTGTTVAVMTVASPETYTTITGVRDIGGAGYDRPLVRATDLADAVESYHLGRADGTQINLEMRYITADAGQEFLRTAHENGDTVTLKVTYPNSATRVFPALIMSMPEAVPDNDHVSITAVLKITGTIVRTDPS